MARRWFWHFAAAFVWICGASAHPLSGDNPFDARYRIRGVDPADYLGFDEYAAKVRALVLQRQLALPPDSKGESYSSGLADFSIVTEAALRQWSIRRLSVRITRTATHSDTADVHLAWPSDTTALGNAFPFREIRHTFEKSTLAPDAPAWVAKRNRLWPDVASVAAKVVVTDRSLDVATCPKLLGDLRRLRDAPPALQLIVPFAELGDTPSDTIVVTADGWGVTMVWNGGPGQFGGGRASPDQSTDLGSALLDLVGDAETCAGLDRTVH